MPAKMKTKSLVGGALLALAGAAIGWSVRAFVSPSAAAADQDEESAPAVPPEKMIVRVTTAQVTRGDLSLVIVATGVVNAAPAAERTLSSRASGRVVETFAKTGERVERDQLLLKFETGPLEAALATAKAGLAQAENQLAEFERTGRERQVVELRESARRTASARQLAEAQLVRLQGLQADGLVSDKALAEAQQAVEQARADEKIGDLADKSFESGNAELQHQNLVASRAAALAIVRDAETVLAEAEVHAQAAGQITEFVARAGERLEPGATIGKLLVSDVRVVNFAVAAAASTELATGARATWDDAGGTSRSGTLARLGVQVDPSSRSVEAFVEPDPGTPAAPPGLEVRGELEVQRLKDVLLVPERAVMRAGDAQVVVLATAGDKAKVTSVKLLGRHAGLAAVEGDMQAGDRVIIEGGYNLPDGAHIVDAGIQPQHATQGAKPDADGK